MPQPTPLRILIVEDDPDDAALVERELRRAGVESACRPVASEDAFLAALSPPPDLVLADYRMPGFGALAALRLLRGRGLEVPLIVVTGTLGDEAAVECLREGATDYLLKDRLGRLGQAVRNAVEQARLRLEQRRRQQLLQAVVDGAAAAVYVKDVDGAFLLVNRPFEALIGRGQAEIVGRRDAEVCPPDVLARSRAQERAALAARAAVDGEEEWTQGGEVRTHWCTRFPLPDLDGELYAVCGISTDVTELKRLEAQLRQSQKMEAVGQLAGGIAHDFNNLLTVILGYSQMLAGRLAADRGSLDMVREVEGAGERATALTQQLLAFSRNQVLQPRVVDLNAVIVEVETLLRRLIGEDVELLTSLGAPSGRALVDPVQFEQVILNLAVNARDAMPGGGVLSIATSEVELDAAYVEARPYATLGPHVAIAVGDTGCGMDAETRGRIFEPFFTTKEKGKGTGLGLSTVYGIVRQSGGHLEVDSEPGRGSTFRVYFPRVAGEAEPPAAAAVPQPLQARSATILLLEDDPPLRTLATTFLESGGYTVIAPASSASALSLAERHPGPIDLVLADVIMPGMSGPEVAARIVAGRPETRVLFISGYTAKLVDRTALQRGAHFLGKPFSARRLLGKVSEVLDEVLDGGDPPAPSANGRS